MLRTINLIDYLDASGFCMNVDMQMDFILQSLLDSFTLFIVNKDMHTFQVIKEFNNSQAHLKGKK